MLDPTAKLLAWAGARPRVLVAFSGGLDSTVLAHSLWKQRRKLGGLRLVHVDHGLQPASAAWSTHCARLAREWRLPFVSVAAQVRVAAGESLEAAAREARYAALAGELAPDEVLVTAQHQDDQAETVLLQLFRGAGVSGLAAMPEYTRFGRGWLARPLLSNTRAELEQYAAAKRLKWVEDPTNQSERFGRNFLRHRVLPVLRKRWPGLDATIARTARHMAEAADLLDETARADLVTTMDGDGLNVAALRRLRPARRRNVLRAFIARANLEQPSSAQFAEMTGPLLAARADAQPHVSCSGFNLRRRAGRLVLQVNSRQQPVPSAESSPKSWLWKEHRDFMVNASGDRLSLVDDPSGNIDLDKLPAVLQLRQRQGGEKLRPGPRARSQSLKKLLQAAKLTVEERARLPLLFAGGRDGSLIAVGDRWLDVSVLANVKSRRRARLVWSRQPDGL
jgi:tRNA(Ile)-lysidine synthase